MKKKINPFLIKILTHCLIILGIILCVETFVCNYKYFLKIPSETLTYELEDLKVLGLKYDSKQDCYIATQNNPTIEIKNINEEIKTIYVDASCLNEKNYQLNISIDYTDETRLNYVSYSKPLQIIKEYENSKYIQEDFNGKTEKIRLHFNVNVNDKLSIGKIKLNERIPFNFSFVRILAMGIISFLIYSFVMLFHYKEKINHMPRFNKSAKIIVTALSVLLILIIYGEMFNGFANYVGYTSGSQISQELVDSFLKGRVDLLTLPNERFLNIVDPYVPDNRIGHSYLWDHVFYNGKYYSYYGITPVFLIFIPFYLLSGYYMYDGYAVLIFSIISTIFLSLTYFTYLKKHFSKLPLFLSLAGYIILFTSCGVLTNIVRPAFYEVSTSCAFMCMSISLYHLIKSSLLDKKEKNNLYHVTTFTIWCSLAVLSRATYALYAICAVIILLIAYFYQRKTLPVKKQIVLIACGLTPFIIFGGIQCLYNYARFQNIFEFGIQYSLTINDFTKTQFHFSYAFTSLWNFLFAFPSITDNLYFIKPHALTFGHSGYYFFETYSAIGLFNRVPLLYAIFALPFIKTSYNFKEKIIFALKYILPCVIIPIIIVMVTWESGFAVRYYSDFAWAMVLFILMLFFKYYENKQINNDLTGIKLCAIIIVVTMLLSFMGQMAIIYDFVPNLGRHIGYEDYRYTYKYYRKARELAFWF